MKPLFALVIIIGLLIVPASLFAGAGRQEPTDDGVIRIGISFDTMFDEAFVNSERYLKGYGQIGEPVVEFTVTVADGDVVKQAADIKDLISKGVDMIVAIAKDSTAIESSVRDAREAGLPFIAFNRPVSPDAAYQADTFVGIDAEYQGYATSKVTFEKMQAAGVDIKLILVSGDIRDENSVQRTAGTLRALNEFGGELLTEVPTGWDITKAASGLPAAMQANPEATVVFVASDYLMPGIQSALEGADRWYPSGHPKHMYLASCDVFSEVLPLIDAGYVDSDSLFDVVQNCSMTIDAIRQIAAGQKVEPVILVKGPVFTPENWDKPEMQALLDPGF
jgi:ABC-type sugar transport system substrate-binding protein